MDVEHVKKLAGIRLSLVNAKRSKNYAGIVIELTELRDAIKPLGLKDFPGLNIFDKIYFLVSKRVLLRILKKDIKLYKELLIMKRIEWETEQLIQKTGKLN